MVEHFAERDLALAQDLAILDQIYEKTVEDGGQRTCFYFLGIGGISMSALAKMIPHLLPCSVWGSDRNPSEMVESLQGIFGEDQVKVGDDPTHLRESQADALIYTLAISPDNPILVAAKKMGIPTILRDHFLGWINRLFPRVINVSGTNGKTTTTGLLSHIMIADGMDPLVHLGATYREFVDGNIRLPEGKNHELMISEACEYQGSFLSFYSTTAILLNIAHDHLDSYPRLEDAIRTFVGYGLRLPEGAQLVVPAFDGPILRMFEDARLVDRVRDGHLRPVWYQRILPEKEAEMEGTRPEGAGAEAGAETGTETGAGAGAGTGTGAVTGDGAGTGTGAVTGARAGTGTGAVTGDGAESAAAAAAPSLLSYSHEDLVALLPEEGQRLVRKGVLTGVPEYLAVHLRPSDLASGAYQFNLYQAQRTGEGADAKTEETGCGADAEAHTEDYSYALVGHFSLRIPGIYNVENALAAMTAALINGAKLSSLTQEVASFTGCDGRFQHLGTFHGAEVILDYAHHPDSLDLVIQAARHYAPDKKIILAFQPITHTRAREFAQEYAKALAKVDLPIVLEVYDTREKDQSFSSAQLVDLCQKTNPQATFLPDRKALWAFLGKQELSDRTCIFVVGTQSQLVEPSDLDPV